MNKRIVLFYLILTIFFIGACSKDVNSVDEKNDVILKHDKIVNLDKFKLFVENVDRGKTSKIRVITYTDEGKPIFKVLNYDGKEIKYILDNSKDKFSSKDNKKQEVICKKVDKNKVNDNVVYFLNGCSAKNIDNHLLSIPIEG